MSTSAWTRMDSPENIRLESAPVAHRTLHRFDFEARLVA